MGRNLSSWFRAASLLLARHTSLVMLVEFPLKDADGSPAGQVVRLARSDRHVVADGLTYQACPMRVGLPSEEGQGRLGSATITIGNASRLPGAYVESGRVLGQRVTVSLAVQDEAGSQAVTVDPAATFRCMIKKATVSPGSVGLELGHPLEGKRTPAPLFTRDKFPGLLAVGGEA